MDYNVSIFPAHARGTLDVNNIFGAKRCNVVDEKDEFLQNALTHFSPVSHFYTP